MRAFYIIVTFTFGMLFGLTAAIAQNALAKTEIQGMTPLQVTVDYAKIVKLPEKTQTVIIGNPGIADILVQKNGVMIVTGKSFGVTNLIALDSTGNMLAQSAIQVVAPTSGLVLVQRGFDQESYSCTPKCEPAIVLGDAASHFGATAGQTGQRNSFAAQR